MNMSKEHVCSIDVCLIMDSRITRIGVGVPLCREGHGTHGGAGRRWHWPRPPCPIFAGVLRLPLGLPTASPPGRRKKGGRAGPQVREFSPARARRGNGGKGNKNKTTRGFMLRPLTPHNGGSSGNPQVVVALAYVCNGGVRSAPLSERGAWVPWWSGAPMALSPAPLPQVSAGCAASSRIPTAPTPGRNREGGQTQTTTGNHHRTATRQKKSGGGEGPQAREDFAGRARRAVGGEERK